MKRFLSISIAIFALALYSTSCETAGDDLELEVSKGQVSADAPQITAIAPGFERAKIEWTLNNAEGTTVETCYIYNGDDVIEVDIDDTYGDNDDLCYNFETKTWSTILPLSEGNHTITIKSYDSNKTLSGASAKTTVYAYGSKYGAELGHRLLLSSSYNGNECTLKFTDDYASTISGVSVTYVSKESTINTAANLIANLSSNYANDPNDDKYKDNITYKTVEMEDVAATSLVLTDAYVDQPVEITTTHKPTIAGAMDDVTTSITRATGGVNEITYVHVTSLNQLRQYMSPEINDHSITMTPGTYYVTAEEFAAGLNYTTSNVTGLDGKSDPAVLLVEGDRNYYDLTGVTIEIDVNAADSHKEGGELHALHTMGDDNVIKGLRMIDVGSVYDDPAHGYVNVIMDGARNRCEDIYTFSLGSSPYGYGECFGKGGSDVMIGHNKHSAWLLRGDDNHIRRCSVIHRAFGHFMFLQGTQSGIIEDCYVEGDMVTTNGIVSEKGSGSAADLIDFFTTWGYKLTDIADKGDDYSLSVGEGGIRTYSSGNTYVNGVYYGTGAVVDEDDDSAADDSSSGSNSSWQTDGGGSKYRTDATKNATGGTFIFRNNILKMTRGPLGLVLAGGTYHVSNITFISSQGGINMRDGSTCRNLKSTVNSTPAIQQPYSTYKNNGGGGNNNNTVDMTIIPYTGVRKSGNGIGSAASIHGHSHKITFMADPSYMYDDYPSKKHPIYGNQLYIALGGLERAIGNYDETIDHETYNNTFDNSTDFILEIGPRSHNNTVTQRGSGAVVIYGGSQSDDIYCYDMSKSNLASWSDATIDKNLFFNNSSTKSTNANTVTVDGDGDVFIYGDGNKVTVNGTGKVYVLGDDNTITTTRGNQIIYASQIAEHAIKEAYFPYNYYSKTGYPQDGYAVDMEFAPTGNKVNDVEDVQAEADATKVSAPQLYKN